MGWLIAPQDLRTRVFPLPSPIGHRFDKIDTLYKSRLSWYGHTIWRVTQVPIFARILIVLRSPALLFRTLTLLQDGKAKKKKKLQRYKSNKFITWFFIKYPNLSNNPSGDHPNKGTPSLSTGHRFDNIRLRKALPSNRDWVDMERRAEGSSEYRYSEPL